MTAEPFARAVRGHWGIENSAHWVLDELLEAEACRRKQKVRLFSESQLASAYLETREERQVTWLEPNIQRHDLIIIDELSHRRL